MRFLADMGVSIRSVKWLRDTGHDIIHLSEVGLHCLPDEEVFNKALEEQRIILTMDLDFSQILAVNKANLPSIVIFRLNDERSENVNTKLSELLNRYSNELAIGVIVSVGDYSIRLRRLPI
jgi:predicted nuclease of predicted toxin-antitoxin system